MYSPKIREDLIPMLYQIKQAQANKPMTQIVDELLRPAVLKLHETVAKCSSTEKGGVITNGCREQNVGHRCLCQANQVQAVAQNEVG